MSDQDCGWVYYYKCKNEVGCRDQKLLKQEGTVRRIVACSQSSSQCLLVSTVFGTVSFLHPTSFLMIFTLVPLIFSAISMANTL